MFETRPARLLLAITGALLGAGWMAGTAHAGEAGSTPGTAFAVAATGVPTPPGPATLVDPSRPLPWVPFPAPLPAVSGLTVPVPLPAPAEPVGPPSVPEPGWHPAGPWLSWPPNQPSGTAAAGQPSPSLDGMAAAPAPLNSPPAAWPLATSTPVAAGIDTRLLPEALVYSGLASLLVAGTGLLVVARWRRRW